MVKFRPSLPAGGLWILPFISLVCHAQTTPQVAQIGGALPWRRLEFRVLNVPTATNVFDPDHIRLDAAFSCPSGEVLTVPAFWYQPYTRALSGNNEVISSAGSGEWRLRFAGAAGEYGLVVTIRTNGLLLSTVTTNFTIPPGVDPLRTGYAQVDPGGQSFTTDTGQALRLVGHNVCWHHSRGTYDYDDWFGSMQQAGENFARLWMCPWAFNLETEPNSLTRYRLDRAWQLDYVVRLAETRGIYLLLCLDYHGMFEVEPDYWGGNNFWPFNPYNATNGGPCLNQNGFFTNSIAKALYQKRLRYLVGRYGYSPNLLAWEFFNEIDNVYRYFNPADVAAWHGEMGRWLRTNDPFGHMVTTSMTGGSDRPEIWSLPELDFAAYHSYGEPKPADRLSVVSQSFLGRYRKPVMIGEFGTDWRGWSLANDPYLRGFRQGLWGGAMGGSAGSTMSWWWEEIHNANLYPLYKAMNSILAPTGWGQGTWTNIQVVSAGDPPPLVGDLLPGGLPFNAHLVLDGGWGSQVTGRLALASSLSADYAGSLLNSFVHGRAHPDLRRSFLISAWLTNNARMVLHLNSVSSGSTLVVRSDSSELFRTNLPNLDGTYNVNNEYDIDFTLNLPAGKRLLEVTNAGSDWFFLDWVRVEGVLPATYQANWQPTPSATGLKGERESLAYVVAPGVAFPGIATNLSPALTTNAAVTFASWPPGEYFADWYDPATGTKMEPTSSITTNALLVLPLPGFREDLAGVIYPRPRLVPLGMNASSPFQFQFLSEHGGRYLLERSTNIMTWTGWRNATNTTGTMLLEDSWVQGSGAVFYRARKP